MRLPFVRHNNSQFKLFIKKEMYKAKSERYFSRAS